MLHAHSLQDRPESDWEALAAHLETVGAHAAGFAEWFGASRVALAAGLLHDIGKCSAQYQAYIRGSAPSPNHSSAGALEALKRFEPPFDKLLAFAIAGHHSGLSNGTGDLGRTGRSLAARMAEAETLPDYSGWEEQVPGLPDAVALDRRFYARRGMAYSLHFFGRMLFSCLVDADFLATEHFYLRAEGRRPDRGNHSTLAVLKDRFDRFMADKVAGVDQTDLNRLRAKILAHARAKAVEQPPGLFTMTVPTGGGKTLASLGFALDHAIAHKLRRIVYVIPYTSIIEQTADIFRKILGGHDVLEHHGNVDWDAAPASDVARADDEGPGGLHKLRRAAENWDVPVVVTTAVQFFESLHAARTSRCRKLHNLAGSVIILDEAQTLPIHLLRPCLAAIDELAANYRASVVLCTATQPAVRKPNFADGLDMFPERELAPDPEHLYGALRRVRVEVKGPTADEEIAARFADQPQMLCIVNTRKHAQLLFDLVRNEEGALHLSTLMCPAHRRAVLAKVRERLHPTRRSPIRLVSTSLVEAGVDVDFPEVWRAEAGLDSLAQAAGRANREGRLAGLGRVVMFEAADHKLPPRFAQAAGATREALRIHRNDPLGTAAIETYFSILYWARGDAALDAARLQSGDVFPILTRIAERDFPSLDFPYASIAEAFRIIEEMMDPVIIPWRGGDDPDEPRRLIENLRGALATQGRSPGQILRRLQQYTVSIPQKSRAAMLASGAAQPISPDFGDRFVWLAANGLYSDDTGLALDPFEMSAEAGIF